MKSKRITDRAFFTCSAEELAPKLLGKIFCHDIGSKILRVRLTETEAYCQNDTACHSNKYKSGNGVISQNMIGGTVYIHYDNKNYPGSSFDIVANEKGIPESVLIRGGVNVDDPEEGYDSKPRLLGEALQIDYKCLNRTDLLTSDEIWIEDDGFDANQKAKMQKRIGLDSAKDITDEDKNKLWRYTLCQ